MHGGYRLLVAAAIGVAAFVTLSTGAYFGALHATHSSNEAAKRADSIVQVDRGDPKQIDRDRAGLPYAVERITSGPDPKGATERENRDLAAQESTSVWTFWMLVASSVGVVATTIGTGFLLWQIQLTRKAVVDTGKATEAMVRQNELTERAQRAWVAIDATPTKIEIKEHSIEFHYEITLNNIGATVAEHVSLDHQVIDASQGRAKDSIATLIEKWSDPKRRRLGDSMMPKEAITQSFWNLQTLYNFEQSDNSKAIYPTLFVYVQYRLEGEDVDKIAWRTFRFCARKRFLAFGASPARIEPPLPRIIAEGGVLDRDEMAFQTSYGGAVS